MTCGLGVDILWPGFHPPPAEVCAAGVVIGGTGDCGKNQTFHQDVTEYIYIIMT